MGTEQRTPEWYARRVGKVTASRVVDVLARTKNGWGASRYNYRADLVAERLTGLVPDGGFVSEAMARGIELEEKARAAYEFYTGNKLTLIDFVDHPSIAMAGASPDAFAGDDGLLELKCPNTATHIEWLLGGTVPKKYRDQMDWQMACTGKLWCDFASFDDRLPEDMQLFVTRQVRDPARMVDVTGAVVEFLREVDETVAALIAKCRERQAA